MAKARGLRGYSHHLPQPFFDLGVVDRIVVHPAFIACVVWWVDVDAVHLAFKLGQQAFQGFQVIAMNDAVGGGVGGCALVGCEGVRRVSAGVAMALAMSQPVSIAPGDTSAFTAAAGSFNGQSALAIGVHHTPIPGLLYSAGLGITTGSSSPAIRVGFSLSF